MIPYIDNFPVLLHVFSARKRFCRKFISSPLPHVSVGLAEQDVGARGVWPAHCMEIGEQKPSSPFSLDPQGHSDFPSDAIHQLDVVSTRPT